MIAYQTDNPSHRIKSSVTYTNIVEVFVYDFIAETNNPSLSHLTHFSMAILHKLHSIPLPPNITKHRGQDLLLQGNIAQGEGTWATMKEILGCNIDGNFFNLQLMPEKFKK